MSFRAQAATRLAAGGRRLACSTTNKAQPPRIAFSHLECRAFTSSSPRYFAENEKTTPREARSVQGATAEQRMEIFGKRRREPAQPKSEFVDVTVGGKKGKLHPSYLRDCCTCSQCVNPSTQQKTFQTSDIPGGIEAKSVKTNKNGDLEITWDHDIAGYGPEHVSTFPQKFLEINSFPDTILRDRSEHIRPRTWNKFKMGAELEYVKHEDYMTKEASLYRTLLALKIHGMVIIQGVPKDEKAVEAITGRIGTIRDTFYGRTWDVKSVQDAKNVAYTQQYLGLHQDLLYMADPPGFQILHSIENSCTGGESLFSDGLQAVRSLHGADVEILANYEIPYHYRNDGQHYYFKHPVIEIGEAVDGAILPKGINYSPPFQAPLLLNQEAKHIQFVRAIKALAGRLEAPEMVFEYKLKEGEAVIFNNRRILHGRKSFDPASGKRWLKGAYVDTDVFMSKLRVLNEKYELTGKELGYEIDSVPGGYSAEKKALSASEREILSGKN